MHSEQILPEADEKGAEQTVHEGPEYLLIADQQRLQKGAYRRLSVRVLQEGHSEGKSKPSRP